MKFRNLPFAMGTIAIIGSTTTASAIEPDAPVALITREEAIVFNMNRRIDRLPRPKEYGEKADRRALIAYYAERRRSPLWVDGDGLTDRAKRAIDEIAKAGSWGLDVSRFDLPDGSTPTGARSLIEDELRLSVAALRYARHARGGRMDPKQLSLDIDRRPPLESPLTVLTSLATSSDPASYLRSLHPNHTQFIKLRNAYVRALQEEANGESDITGGAESETRKSKRSRRSNSARQRAKRLLYNMEMWRWMPRDLGSRYVIANIPEYRIRVMNGDRIVHEERMVVGKVQNKTPMFSDEMETVVFHPFWNVPNSIKVKELLPGLVKGSGIMEKQGLKIKFRGQDINPRSINWSTTDIRNYHVYQPPSRRNALGVVKFLFPNKHAIYFHDTPSKHLFKRKSRAYSHGCMRVRNPLKLAQVLLGPDKGWTGRRIRSLVNDGPKNNQIALNNKVPVHIVYFTARIDAKGQLSLFKDVYGHEERIQMGLDGKAHLIVKPKRDLDEARRKVVSSVASNVAAASRPPRDQSWRRRVFGN